MEAATHTRQPVHQAAASAGGGVKDYIPLIRLFQSPDCTGGTIRVFLCLPEAKARGKILFDEQGGLYYLWSPNNYPITGRKNWPAIL